MAQRWQQETFATELITRLRQQLTDGLRAYNASSEAEQARLTERVAAIRRERYKWAEKAMDGSAPADIAREKLAKSGCRDVLDHLAQQQRLGCSAHAFPATGGELKRANRVSVHLDSGERLPPASSRPRSRPPAPVKSERNRRSERGSMGSGGSREHPNFEVRHCWWFPRRMHTPSHLARSLDRMTTGMTAREMRRPSSSAVTM